MAVQLAPSPGFVFIPHFYHFCDFSVMEVQLAYKTSREVPSTCHPSRVKAQDNLVPTGVDARADFTVFKYVAKLGVGGGQGRLGNS